MGYRPLIAAAAVIITTQAASAAPVDVDLMFVIDQSGSMSDEFSTLAANIAVVFDGLATSSEIGSVAAGVVSYEAAASGTLSLVQSLTTSAATLATALASVPVFGGTEDALSAVASVLPGGSLFSSAGWRNDTVKSIILITDEDADDYWYFSYKGLTGYAALGAQLDDANYLNNIITSSYLFDTYEEASRPYDAGEYEALFALEDFTGYGADPEAFLAAFAATKLDEITTGGETTPGSEAPSPVPLPASLPLLLSGLAGLSAQYHRKKKKRVGKLPA